MLNSNLVKEFKKFAALADEAEAKDNFRDADLAQAEADAVMRIMVREYYGAMPVRDCYGDMIIPSAIRQIIDDVMPDAVFVGLA